MYLWLQTDIQSVIGVEVRDPTADPLLRSPIHGEHPLMSARGEIELAVTFGPSSSLLVGRAIAYATQHAKTSAEVAPRDLACRVYPRRRPRLLCVGTPAARARGELEGDGGPGGRIRRAPCTHPLDDLREGAAQAGGGLPCGLPGRALAESASSAPSTTRGGLRSPSLPLPICKADRTGRPTTRHRSEIGTFVERKADRERQDGLFEGEDAVLHVMG